MCGITGYIGTMNAVPILLRGLERLEYRGYDSAGVAAISGGCINVRKAKGRLQNLKDLIEKSPIEGSCGIGHTRWATHGEPSDINSHPHTDVKGEIAIVHNGIIENYLPLKKRLEAQGCRFVSETDTEVVAHLLNVHYCGDMLKTLQSVVKMLRGSYALAVICKAEPDKIFCIRHDSPLVIGCGADGSYLASDIPAIIEYTRDIYIPDDDEPAVLTADGAAFYNSYGEPIDREPLHVDWNISSAEKSGYAHFMLKEIHEQPAAIHDTVSPLIDRDTLAFRSDMMKIDTEAANAIENICIVACGTAYHAGMMGKAYFEKFARIPCEVNIASEYRYSDPIIRPNTLFIVVSQSGETADTIAAMREGKRRGCKVLAVTNVIGSTVYREADMVMPTWAGPEIAVASTKAYISQVCLLYCIALDVAEKRGRIGHSEVSDRLRELLSLPEKAETLLGKEDAVQRAASRCFSQKSVFFIGRGLDYYLALEASLKLKEISYIHSEAYAAGELKHGTIALIEPGTLVVAPVTQKELLEKTAGNIKEVKVRGAHVIALCSKECAAIEAEADEAWMLPEAPAELLPILSVIPMQLFAYYMALENGCEIDKPRNLAKSVTVE